MSLERYSKQVLFRDIREAGQRRICDSRVLICGCGALGSALADGLARAGVGFLRIVDRDFVEISNLQRQVLFDEEDVRSNLPKAVAAGRKLAKINSSIALEPIVADIDHTNILELARDIDLIVDGMDNFETRFLMNDAALELQKPWIYGGCIGSHGQTMAIFPGDTACLQCLIEAPPGPGAAETCDTAGVLAPIISVIASLQIIDALKVLTGRRDLIAPVLTVVDVWDGTFRRMNMANLRDQAQCTACVGGKREWLHGHKGSQTTVLCGRNAVQISPSERVALSLPELAERLRSSGEVALNPFLLRLNVTGGEHQVTVFPDGRAIIKGTPDPAVARTLYARYVGS